MNILHEWTLFCYLSFILCFISNIKHAFTFDLYLISFSDEVKLNTNSIGGSPSTRTHVGFPHCKKYSANIFIVKMTACIWAFRIYPIWLHLKQLWTWSGMLWMIAFQGYHPGCPLGLPFIYICCFPKDWTSAFSRKFGRLVKWPLVHVFGLERFPASLINKSTY